MTRDQTLHSANPQSAIPVKHTDLARVVLAAVLAVCCQSVYAKCGGVDYSWGADGLAKAHDFVITMLLYVVYVCYAVAGIVSVIASLQIYFKINAGEEGWKKEIMMVVGAILFIIGATVVFPAFFGYRI
ncbi:DUF4134 domain-containing protein [Bacteroides pyogenes]|nr:DUF4134 domain-containing protein [Bacteroides pyogenes]MCE9107381.1 DUF4134 domain-containing protein [Bacteroides pyogenes]MCF0254702.1 DUF4134 domain-containing protein [Bacteroides heparinolyticus]